MDSDKPLAAMSWMQRLKRLFAIDIETCPVCGGQLRSIACVEEPARATASCLRLMPYGQTAQALSPALIAKIRGHIRTRDELASLDARGPGGRIQTE